VDHPTAAVWLAWDRDSDTIYITDTYRKSEPGIAGHAMAIRARGDWVPIAWPHDGLQRDKGGSGEQLAKQYRDQGLNLLKDKATFEDGSNGVEAGLSEMLTRMQTMRLRVFSHLEDWFEEFRLYHRKDGMVVKLTDDLMSATRYAMMMRRMAKTQEEAEARIRTNRLPTATPFGVFDEVTGY
ncbi:MAG: DNA packaging protein, partial [Betaproteobacteria bacterium]|nr:DNA packaging protein [Betaproteobacteria bacterium]